MSARAGIALTSDALHAVGADGSATRTSLAGGINDRGYWPDLAEALRALPGSGSGGSLAVALLPPLVDVVLLELPPIDDAAAIQLLSRNAGRYFVNARGAQTIGVLQRRGKRGEPSSVLAATAPARVIAAIDAAARESGWTVSHLSPAEGAWAAAAVTIWPALSRRTAHVLVHEADRTVLLELHDGKVAGVRRFRAGAADADLIADAIEAQRGAAGSPVGALGAASGRQELHRALGARGIAVNQASGEHAALADVPPMVAARFAARSAGPLLMNEQARDARRRRQRMLTAIVATAAVVLIGLAAALHLWGVRRELREVKAQRTAIRPLVSATLVGRTSTEDAYRRVAAIAAASRTAPHWAPVVAELSAMLPDDAFLTAMRTRGDSIVVDGEAASASRAFEALNDSKLLAALRAPAPVRRQAPDGGDPMEHFSLAAILKRAAVPAVTAPNAAPNVSHPAGAQ